MDMKGGGTIASDGGFTQGREKKPSGKGTKWTETKWKGHAREGSRRRDGATWRLLEPLVQTRNKREPTRYLGIMSSVYVGTQASQASKVTSGR